MGSPDPLDVQGKCIATSLHVGENKLRYNFVQAYSRFDGEVMQAYMEFLDDTFGHVGCPAHGDEMTDNPDADESESNSGKGDGDSEGDEDDKDHPLNAILGTYTPPMEAIATFSTDVVTNLASVATPLVNMISPNVATCPVPAIQYPCPLQCLPIIAKQSRDNVQAYTPTLNPADLSLALGVPNLTAGLPMAYGDASHPISSMMVFDFPALSVCETDIGAMMYRNTSFTTSSTPVQLSFSSTYRKDITVVEPIPGNPSSDTAQVATPLAAIETAMCCLK
ncbi:hypothetical protein EDC04DRAFT_2605242 [Pisolithus marmoratus]|nr:hypothetical protein EDC04DRAFT_2605242 [Pisolithus marmoratus]